MNGHLSEFTAQIRKKSLKSFKNGLFGSKFLEVMIETFQLIFQQRKATKQVSLNRQREQYEELVVRRLRQLQALGKTEEELYVLLRGQLKSLGRRVNMNIGWWKPPVGEYSNMFYYLDNRYFNLKGVIQYEIILSSAKGAVVSD